MARRIDNLKPWPKGVSGNPGGRPKKNHITRIYEKVLAKGENRKELEADIMAMLHSRRMVSVLLLRELTVPRGKWYSLWRWVER